MQQCQRTRNLGTGQLGSAECGDDTWSSPRSWHGVRRCPQLLVRRIDANPAGVITQLGHLHNGLRRCADEPSPVPGSPPTAASCDFSAWPFYGARASGPPSGGAPPPGQPPPLPTVYSSGWRPVVTEQALSIVDPDGSGVLVLNADRTLESATSAASCWLADLDRAHNSQLPTAFLTVVEQLTAPRNSETGPARARVRALSGRWLTVHASFLDDARLGRRRNRAGQSRHIYSAHHGGVRTDEPGRRRHAAAADRPAPKGDRSRTSDLPAHGQRSRQSDAREDRGIQRRTASGAPLWPHAGSATEGSTFGQP